MKSSGDLCSSLHRDGFATHSSQMCNTLSNWYGLILPVFNGDPSSAPTNHLRHHEPQAFAAAHDPHGESANVAVTAAAANESQAAAARFDVPVSDAVPYSSACLATNNPSPRSSSSPPLAPPVPCNITPPLSQLLTLHDSNYRPSMPTPRVYPRAGSVSCPGCCSISMTAPTRPSALACTPFRLAGIQDASTAPALYSRLA
ncbi:hypothetical protein HYPSUDRAFT_208311 [Hypholoma sublateritium FD-334 SS-4]|uniref:Uncharacterized protein n=1 Tax=Hypholoma sublateritium (strain FD-334 SS-4) TaxID=945553 RepID=A0A0D2P2V1_HYPSF|nr:hypothetical protein HYPSUDRAFT_208311 [Hypholoma sublateritium FD-334 SS-4]